MSYINVPVVTDSDVMIQQALTNISNNIPGWTPHEGNLEVLLLEQFALMASEAATVASNVPDTIFQYFGSLIGITPNNGTRAVIATNWTLVSSQTSYTIPAGTVAGFFYNGASYQFQLIQDLVFTGTNTATTVYMEAVSTGSGYNLGNVSGLNAVGTYMTLTTPNPLVSAIQITVVTPTNSYPTVTLGTDAETSSAFYNRLTQELQLLAPRPITTSDYSIYAQTFTNVYRAMAFDGFNPLTNLFGINDAQNGSSTTGWTAFGNGTTNIPTLAYGSSGITVTTYSTAMVSGAAVNTAAAQGATSITVTSTSFQSTISSSHPSAILITDSGSENEIVFVTGVTTSSPNQTLTLATPLRYAHTISATVTQLQGAASPVVNVTSANSKYIFGASHVKCGTDTTATAGAYIAAIATYSDGTQRAYSSANVYGSQNSYDYTAFVKTLTCVINSGNDQDALNTSIAPASNSQYNNVYAGIAPYVTSIQTYVGFTGAGTTKTHIISYNNVSQTTANVGYQGNADPDGMGSLYNLIPDATLSNFFTSGSTGASWTLPTGISALPGFGLQYFSSSGTAIGGSGLTATSQVFNVSNYYDTSSSTTARPLTLFANIDTTFVPSAQLSAITVSVVNASTGTALTGATITPTIVGNQLWLANFNVSSAQDVYVKITLGSTVTVPANESIVISGIALFPGTYTQSNYPSPSAAANYAWTTGGLYAPGTFNYTRTVTLCPVDANGLPVSFSTAQNIDNYFTSKREANFTVNVIQPSYYPIDVQWSALVQPGYSALAVQTAANNAVYNFLSPANWAGGDFNPPYWDPSFNTVRCFDIAGVIAEVPGIASVTSVFIAPYNATSGGSDTYVSTQIALPGVSMLPIANNVQGSAYTNNTATAYNTFG
jgi:Baseplate J-like protein